MTRKELIADIKDFVGGGGFVSINQLAKYLKKSRDTKGEISVYVKGLMYMPDGRGKKFFIPDVADRILGMMVKE